MRLGYCAAASALLMVQFFARQELNPVHGNFVLRVFKAQTSPRPGSEFTIGAAWEERAFSNVPSELGRRFSAKGHLRQKDRGRSRWFERISRDDFGLGCRESVAARIRNPLKHRRAELNGREGEMREVF